MSSVFLSLPHLELFLWHQGCSQLHKLWLPLPKTIPARCGISQPCSLAELKGQQISASTVFMLSGTETQCQLKEFIWCHRDFFSPPTATLYVYKGEGGSSANTGDSYKFFLQLFCCCLQSTCRDGVKWNHVTLWLTVTQRFSPNSLEVNNARKSINVNGTEDWEQNYFVVQNDPVQRKSRNMGYWSNSQSWSN